ncbi:MAG: hypothetical protein LOD90_04345, partial [Symbiobacteriaceae bacterium]
IRKLAVTAQQERAGHESLHHAHHVGGLVEHVEVVLNVIEVVKVRKIEEENDFIYLEGVSVPAFLGAFQMHIVPADE